MFVCTRALIFDIIGAEYILFTSEPLIIMTHCVYIKSHDPVISINKVLVHPIKYVFGFYSELDHEAQKY